MSADNARRDSHAADHGGKYDRAHDARAHCAATARSDPRTRHCRRDVRLCRILPCRSFSADGLRRWCGRGRRPLTRLRAAAAQFCLLSSGPEDGLGPADGLGRRRFRTSRRFSRRGRCRQEATVRVPRRWRRWGALCHPDRRALRLGALCHHVQPGNFRRARGCGYHRLQLRPGGCTWHRLALELCHPC